MVMRRQAALLLISLMLRAAATAAQESSPPLPAAEFGASIDVRTVNVEVVVTDRRGHRVPGLKASDFRLMVDGHQVPVDDFTEVEDGQAASPAGEIAETTEAAAPAAPPATPATTAATANAGAVGTSYLVFVDESFAIASDRNLMLKKLQEDLPVGPADRMAIVAFNGRKLELLKDWTGDREALRQTLQEIQKRGTQGIEKLVKRGRAEEDDASGEGEWEALLGETQSAAQAAAGAMRGVSPPPGRKVLLLICGGWPALPRRPLLSFQEKPEKPKPAASRESDPFSSRDATDNLKILKQPELLSAANLASSAQLFEPVTGTANLLGYTIYPIPLAQHASFAIGADVLADAPTPIDRLGFISTPWGFNVNDAMGYMARETGGKVLYNTLRTSAFKRIAEDLHSYYWLAFTPQWHADGGNHQITVQVLRPGLKARNRSGFADLSKGEVAGLKRDSLLLFGITPQAAAIQIETGKPKWAGIGMIDVPVTIVIPVKVLTPVAVDGGYALRARLSMDSLDSGGGGSHLRDVPLMMKLSAAPREGDFTRYHTTLKLRRAQQTLTFAILDDEGEGQGWAELKFKP
jgi:VWFA-related protein